MGEGLPQMRSHWLAAVLAGVDSVRLSGLMVTDFPSLVVQKTWKEAEFQWVVHSPTWKEIATSEKRGWTIEEEKHISAEKGLMVTVQCGLLILY